MAAPTPPTKAGHDFAGWFKDTSFEEGWTFETDVVNDDITLYANWNPIEYTITFDGNGGTPASQTKTAIHGETITAPGTIPTRTGYEFVGWFDTTNATGGNEFKTTTTFTQAVTYYARWQSAIKEIVYTFTSKSWEAEASIDKGATFVENWTSGQDGLAKSEQGIQVNTAASGANATSKVINNIVSIEVIYATNASNGVGTIETKIGLTIVQTFTVTKPSSGGDTPRSAGIITVNNLSGAITITAKCTTNSVYINSIKIKYSPN